MYSLDENVIITQENDNSNTQNKTMTFVVNCDSEFMNSVNTEPHKKPDLKELLQHLSELESEKKVIMNNLQKTDLNEKSKSQEENLLKAVNYMIENINEYIKKEEEEKEEERKEKE